MKKVETFGGRLEWRSVDDHRDTTLFDNEKNFLFDMLFWNLNEVGHIHIVVIDTSEGHSDWQSVDIYRYITLYKMRIFFCLTTCHFEFWTKWDIHM